MESDFAFIAYDTTTSPWCNRATLKGGKGFFMEWMEFMEDLNMQERENKNDTILTKYIDQLLKVYLAEETDLWFHFLNSVP